MAWPLPPSGAVAPQFRRSIFLTDVRSKTLPIQMLQCIEESLNPTVIAIPAILVTLTVVVLIIGDRLVGLRRMAAL